MISHPWLIIPSIDSTGEAIWIIAIRYVYIVTVYQVKSLISGLYDFDFNPLMP